MNNVVTNVSTPSSMPSKHDQLTLSQGESKASNFVHYTSEGKLYTLGESTHRNGKISEDEVCCEVDEESCWDIEEESCCDIGDLTYYDLQDEDEDEETETDEV